MRTKSPLLVPPPLLALGLLLASAILASIGPNPTVPIPLHGTIGGLLAAAGFLMAGAGLRTFRRAGTTIRPGERAARLITSGPYRFTRNPMYLGLTLFLLAVFFVTESLLFLIPPVAFFLLINLRLIPFEEQLLTEQFGQAYADYCRKVRRWV
jgi:protein-S-isoprenylcysteine O-methyltransferase Ste14